MRRVEPASGVWRPASASLPALPEMVWPRAVSPGASRASLAPDGRSRSHPEKSGRALVTLLLRFGLSSTVLRRNNDSETLSGHYCSCFFYLSPGQLQTHVPPGEAERCSSLSTPGLSFIKAALSFKIAPPEMYSHRFIICIH